MIVSSGAYTAAKILTSGATVTPDFKDSNMFTLALGIDATLANPTSPVAGQSGTIFITHTGAARTLGYGTQWLFAGTTHPVLSTTGAGVIDVLHYTVMSSTQIICALTKGHA